MTKKAKEPTNEALFSELKKEAKKANQRILRLERLTGKTGTFATKQLYDYLDTDVLNAITTKGRVAVRKSFTELQMESILKAVKEFNEGVSTVKKVKQVTKEFSKEAGVNLSFSQANTYYHIQDYNNIIKRYFESSFWEIAREVVKNGYSYDRFREILKGAVNSNFTDELLKEDLKGLYNYIQGVKY